MDYVEKICLALAGLNGEDKLLFEKAASLIELTYLLKAYEREGILGDLIQAIASKKTAFICEAASKGDLKEIFKQPKVHYDYNKINPVGKYHVPEEELICWSWASLKGPLAEHGCERFMEVFKQVFPQYLI